MIVKNTNIFHFRVSLTMFKGCHFPSDVILQTLRYYFAYKLSYRDIEEIQKERGVCIDHATINRWVIKFEPILEMKARQKRELSPLHGEWMRLT